MRLSSSVVMILLSLGAIASSAFAQAFTYQGRLTSSGAPVAGNVDLRFRLYTSSFGITQIGGTLEQLNVPIADGFITVELDFGADAFDGNDRWLQIDVRLTGNPTYTSLSPRQEILPVPVAQFALDAHMPFKYSGIHGVFTEFFNGRVGISVDPPLHKLHVVETTTTNDAAAIYGQATATVNGIHGVRGDSASSFGRGVYGLSTGSAGVGVHGANSGGDFGTGVSGSATSATGATYGVVGQSQSSNGTGASGRAWATSGETVGVEGIVASADGYAGYFTGPAGSRNYFERSVGIGTVDPATLLSVAGEADFLGPVSIGITGADARLLVRGTIGEDAFRVRVDSSTKLVVKDNGGVGIGSNFPTLPANSLRVAGGVGIGTDPAFQLHLSANSAAKPTSNVWTVFSDARLKKDIQPIEHALDDLLALRGVTYQWKDPSSQGGMAGTYTGMIAQDVEKVFPEWISEDAQGYKTLTVIGFEGIVVEALRELRDEKDAEIAALQVQVDQLKALVAELAESRRQGNVD